jgi:hypothetical protein
LTTQTARTAQLGLLSFLAITAIAGGIALLTGAIAPPTDLLQDSVFTDYTWPGLALLGPVGMYGLLAALLVWRRHPLANLASFVAGLMILCYEVVEVAVVGSEPGVARNLQLLYLSVGALIVAASTVSWMRGGDRPG